MFFLCANRSEHFSINQIYFGVYTNHKRDPFQYRDVTLGIPKVCDGGGGGGGAALQKQSGIL
jgi:hypothetical protein